MTYNQIINFIMKRLGNRTQLKSMIEDELQYQKDYVLERDPQLRPWFLLNDTFTQVPTVVDQNYVDLPTDFNSEYEEGFLYLSDGVTEVFKETFDIRTARSKEADDTTELAQIPTGENPQWYSIVGSRMYLFPTPNKVQNLNLRYYRKTGDLAEEATNPWMVEAADLLANAAGAAVAESIEHTEQFRIFEARALRARQRVMAESEERKIVNHSGIPE